MKAFDVQAVAIRADSPRTFRYVADPKRLPEWTHAFRSVSGGRAVLATPRGSVEIGLRVASSEEAGTVDWMLEFPDGAVARACSRVVDAGDGTSIYTFVLLPPPVPLAELEGALEAQSRTLRAELAKLRQILEEA